MKLDLKTTVRTDIETFWRKLKAPESLQFVASPLIHFRGIRSITLNEDWKEGEMYFLPMEYFGWIPAGVQAVTMARIDDATHTIVTDESGGVAKKWIHTMILRSTGSGTVEYYDTLKIEAGIKTPFLWLFVQLFYRHRQRRWKKLLLQS